MADFDQEEEKPPVVTFSQPLDEGYNRFILTVTSVDGTETVYDGECEYTPVSQQEQPVEENVQEEQQQTEE